MSARTKQRGNAAGSEWRPRDVPAAEWVIAVLSALLVLGMLGYTLREALTRSDRPAILDIRTDSIVAAASGHLLMFTVRNSGGTTAAQVQINGELTGVDGGREQSQATIDYVPVGASRSATLQFTTDPRSGRLDLRVVGFDRP